MSDTKPVSEETQKKIAAFEQAEEEYTKAWAEFEEKAAPWFKILEEKRDLRNRTLDEAIRAVREDAKEVDYTKLKTFKAGPFSVQKKVTRFFAPDLFYNMAKALNLVDGAISEGVIAEKIEVNFEQAMTWLKKNSLWDKFKDTYKEQEQTPAVSGPKEVPAFGAALKRKDK
jgi:hypothetical protein